MTHARGSRRSPETGAIVVLVLAAAFAWGIGLRPDGGWYSASWAHRLQTEALFRGTFALQPVPHGQMADWVWARGSHQVWGLGVPLVRLPFEAMAKLVGGIGFPDRVTLWLAFVGVVVVVSRAFGDRPPWEQAALVVTMAFSPAFVTLCRTRLSVYEEASAYACLCGMLLAGLLLRLATTPTPRRFVVVCLAAGCAPFFRPTLMFTAAATVVVAGAVAWRSRVGWRDVLLAGTALAVGPMAWGIINQARFGTPFETGQLLNVSYIPVDQFSKVFGYPFWFEPWRSAVAELVSSLFLATGWNGVDWYQSGIHPWQSETVRFREFYFWTFHPAQGAVLFLSWIGIALACVARTTSLDPRVGVAGLWSFLVCVALFGFYCWAPSMTSRYAVDFAPAFAMGTAGLWLLLFECLARHRGVTTLLAVGAMVWVTSDVVRAEISPTHTSQRLVTADVLRTQLPRPVTSGASLPIAYRCGEHPERFGVKFNGSGWRPLGDCTVDPGTLFFFPHPECLRVEVAPPGGMSTPAVSDLGAVRAKIGLTELARVSEEATAEGVRLMFCPTHERVPLDGIELVYFGWMDPRQVVRGSRPLRLLSVETVAR